LPPINRMLDGEFQLQMGAELVREVVQRSAAKKPALMLVSNYPEAQAEAQEAGALPGFGKRELHAPTTGERIRAALGRG
jgi:two-component system, chemotaxis family, chemotaxis protein CheY